MSKPNPLPLLVKHCDLKLSTLRQVLHPIYYQHADSLHRLCKAPAIKDKTHRDLCDLTLTYWGRCDERNIKNLLWNCYFPGHQPHIWHVLFYMLEIPMSKLGGKSGLTERQIRKYLTKPKVPQAHVRAIARFAMEYRDAMSSKKQRADPDPRYMILHRALTDPKRMYERGEIVAD